MEDYIRQVFELLAEQEYIDLFYAYDIVNEAIMDDGKLRQNHWSEIIGDDYIWYAFYYADKYAPDSIDLYYNDYNEQFKNYSLVPFVRTLVDEDGNFLLDGIGLQAHLYTKDDQSRYFRAIDSLSAAKLKLAITELDVSLGTWQQTLKPTEDNLAEQGKFYKNLVRGLIERVNHKKIQMDSFTFWGFADKLSWRSSANPLLLDDHLHPKPSFWGVVEALQHKQDKT